MAKQKRASTMVSDVPLIVRMSFRLVLFSSCSFFVLLYCSFGVFWTYFLVIFNVVPWYVFLLGLANLLGFLIWLNMPIFLTFYFAARANTSTNTPVFSRPTTPQISRNGSPLRHDANKYNAAIVVEVKRVWRTTPKQMNTDQIPIKYKYIFSKFSVFVIYCKYFSTYLSGVLCFFLTVVGGCRQEPRQKCLHYQRGLFSNTLCNVCCACTRPARNCNSKCCRCMCGG